MSTCIDWSNLASWFVETRGAVVWKERERNEEEMGAMVMDMMSLLRAWIAEGFSGRS
tara:strand:+ start:724 stop:894 length:171 start_codon:yes stop_codon:yes gene_type:complete